MELRSLPPDAAIHPPQGEAAGAIARLIGCSVDPQFGHRGIEQFARLLPLGWWTVYRVFDDAPLLLHFGGCLQPEDCVADAFSARRDGLWRHDRALGGVRERVARGESVLSHLHALELAPSTAGGCASDMGCPSGCRCPARMPTVRCCR